ncbi:hypothetical protein MMC16_001006 [Acarospora aff. strigata]|nr:hypothetical protein [Acarospora aff. strigata]
MVSSLLFTLLLAVPAFSNPLLERNQCNRDNVLRALVNPKNVDEAVKFCSTYIQVPPVTHTVSNIPPDCPTRTAITLVIDPLPVTVTTTPTYTVTVTSATTTYTPYITPYYKRNAPLPTYVSQYPPSRVSSACSCLTITPTTRTTTQTTCPPPHTVVVTEAPPAPTFTVTAASSVVITSYYTTTRTLPALCKPTNFKEYKSGVIPQPVKLQQTTGNTETDCCETCYNAKNCGYFQFRPDNSPAQRCEYYIGTEKTDPSPRVDICPLGVSKTSRLDSPVGAGSGQFFLNYGPCLSTSPLNG